MNEAQALLDRAERGTLKGPDLVWAAAQRRHRPQLLVSAALAAFVLVSVAALFLAGRGSGDSSPPVATVPPTVTVPVATINPAGGTTCDTEGFCAEVSGTAPELRVRLTWQGVGVSSFDTDACSAESVGRSLGFTGGTTDANGATTFKDWAGTAPLAVERVEIPGVEVHQLKFVYQGMELHAFYAQSTDDLSAALGSAFMSSPDGWTAPQPSACDAKAASIPTTVSGD